MSLERKLKIFLPKRLTEAGGTSTFVRNFKKEMEARGHEVTLTWTSDYDIMLISPTAPLRYLFHAKLSGKKIVHRLDGVYYPGSSAGYLWRLLNVQLSIIRTIFADALVYQSNYSKHVSDTRLWPVSSKKPFVTIYNGTDTDRFNPEGPVTSLKDNPDQHVFVTASRFRTEDQIIPLIDSFRMYRDTYEKNSKLVLIGPFQERVAAIPQRYKNEPGIHFLGTIPNAELTSYLRGADVFVMTHKTPPCPNNIIEAMSCGLPICGVADGAMPELVTTGSDGELIPEPEKNDLFPTKLFTENMVHAIKQRSQYSQKARLTALQRFSLGRMVDAYQLFLRKTIQS